MKMENKNNLHVRLDYSESLEGKKQLLSSEMNILRLLKSIKNYIKFRRRELILKTRIRKELSSLRININNLLQQFPKKIGDEEIRIKKRTGRKTKTEQEKKHMEDIESQLQDIQSKLNGLNS
jgi:hypothetical protein